MQFFVACSNPILSSCLDFLPHILFSFYSMSHSHIAFSQFTKCSLMHSFALLDKQLYIAYFAPTPLVQSWRSPSSRIGRKQYTRQGCQPVHNTAATLLHVVASHRHRAHCGKCDVIYKVHDLLQRQQRRIEPRQQATCVENLVTVGSVVSEICIRNGHTDIKQTNKQTNKQ